MLPTMCVAIGCCCLVLVVSVWRCLLTIVVDGYCELLFVVGQCWLLLFDVCCCAVLVVGACCGALLIVVFGGVGRCSLLRVVDCYCFMLVGCC